MLKKVKFQVARKYPMWVFKTTAFEPRSQQSKSPIITIRVLGNVIFDVFTTPYCSAGTNIAQNILSHVYFIIIQGGSMAASQVGTVLIPVSSSFN